MPNQEGYGFLHPVKEADRKENGPVMTGTAVLNGKTVKIAGWAKVGERTKVKYLSLKFQDHEVEVAVDAPSVELGGDFGF